MRVAVCTVATRDYVEGAELLFGSLGLFNDLRDMDLVCFTDLNDSEKSRALSRVRFIPLINRSQHLTTSTVVPRFSKTLYKLQAVELLEAGEYDFVVLMDSDMLCTGLLNREELFSSNAPLKAVLDYGCRVYYRDEIEASSLDLSKIINTGFLVLGKKLLEYTSYDSLMSYLEREGSSYDGSDQGYMNWYIQKLDIPFETLDVTMNYALDPYYPFRFSVPKIIHFTGAKPWLHGGVAESSFEDRLFYKAAKRVTEGLTGEFRIFGLMGVRMRIRRDIVIGWLIRMSQMVIGGLLLSGKRAVKKGMRRS
jgi:lipopolysaccharide biosynthesis glycosyltransferase